MAEIVDIESYRLARVLLKVLSLDAEPHAIAMARRMARRRDDRGAQHWLAIADAIGHLQRLPRKAG
ncbi:MAG: hypothetical protein ACM31L_15640 [Actinomycetota bacterium]